MPDYRNEVIEVVNVNTMATVEKATTEEMFYAAVEAIRELPKNGSYQPSNSLLLRFYGFFKQATLGPCYVSKPAFWDIVGRAKWDAWNKLGNMPKEEAMQLYIEELKKQIREMIGEHRDEAATECARSLTPAEKEKIVETMAYTERIGKFMDVLGPFYEMVDFGDKAKDANAAWGKLGGTEKLEMNGNGNHDIEDNDEERQDQVIRIKKEGASDKYFTDSDSDNDEYADPIEEQVEEIVKKFPKKGKTDHNDNDSGFADQVEYSSALRSQNGSDHMLMVDPHNQLWAMYSNELNGNGIGDSPSQLLHSASENSNMPDAEFEGVSNNGLDPRMMVKGIVARGGGDEDEAGSSSAGGPSGQRRGTQDAGRGQGNRDYLNQPTMGLLGRSPGLGGSGRGGPGRGPQKQGDDISEQIAMALLRLQRDMDSVLARLNVLETVALAQHNTAQDRLVAQLNMQSPQMQLMNSAAAKPSWWPFKDMSYRSFFFFLTWPIILHVIIKIVSRRRARRLLRQC